MTIAHILVTGGEGQLGRALSRAAWPDGIQVHAVSRSECDVCRLENVSRLLDERPWAAVINAAAFTDVEGAEDAPAQAFQVNALGPAVLAQATRAAAVPLIHVSTDFVFGDPGPHEETARTQPLNVYGASKRAGELAVLAAASDAVVVRTAWLFDAEGRNFVTRILDRAGDEQLDIVSDEVGSPTAAADLAQGLLRLVAVRLQTGGFSEASVLHFANEGSASRYELAQAVFDAWAGDAGTATPRLRAVSAAAFAAKARRPSDSRLSCEVFARVAGYRARHWREAVQEVVDQIKAARAGRVERPDQ